MEEPPSPSTASSTRAGGTKMNKIINQMENYQANNKATTQYMEYNRR